MRRPLGIVVFTACLALLPGTTRAQAVVVNPPLDRALVLSSGQPIVGQSFVAPSSGLTDFTFIVGGQQGSEFDFQAGIGTVSGGVLNTLFLSAVQTGIGIGTYIPVNTILATPLAVTTGETYVAFLQYVSEPPTLGVAGGVDVYGDGQAYHGSGGSLLPDPGTDLIFQANFTTLAPVTAPEPASVTLLATGLIGVFGAAGRRKRTRPA
jgi:hypothetical protein